MLSQEHLQFHNLLTSPPTYHFCGSRMPLRPLGLRAAPSFMYYMTLLYFFNCLFSLPSRVLLGLCVGDL